MTSSVRDLYPPLEPLNTFRLKVSDLHELYVEECGNPKGKPVVFLHGGPGGGISADHRRYFDPDHYRIILFDQRGSGRSRPIAELRENTTWDLVADIERIRAHFGIEKWHVFGGSWGSTLSLAYAIRHPEHVSALILRGIFLCRPSELSWFYQDGASELFPDIWESFVEPIAPIDRGDLMRAYHKKLTHDDPAERLHAARAWSKWEAATSRLIIDLNAIDAFDEPDYALSFARIECHYFVNNAFFPTDNFLIENVAKFRKIPGWIIQGRYDVVCPPRSAWDLHRAWPEAKMQFVQDAGHAASEPGIRSALLNATDAARTL